MKRLTALFFAVFTPVVAHTWGFYGHQWINHIAVYTLPGEMLGFYKENLHSIISNAVKPDMRRYAVAEEGMRHYIDIDHYEKALPLDTLPFSWKDAVEKIGEDTLHEHGIGPWHAVRMKHWLTEAFVKGDRDRIIRISSELGHYVADLCVPLHTTSNYNGQKTGQHGIHGLWESRIPELFLIQYDLLVDSAVYINDVGEYIWNLVETSHAMVQKVLDEEKRASTTISEADKYSFEKRGTRITRNYSRPFAYEYSQLMDGMVERRLVEAIHAVGSVWYTAWVDAGQPDMSSEKNELKQPGHIYIQNDSLYGAGKMIGRQE